MVRATFGLGFQEQQAAALAGAGSGAWMTRCAAIRSCLSDSASCVGLLSACVLIQFVVDRLFQRWQHPAVGL